MKKYPLWLAAIISGASLLFAYLSLGKLGDIGDSNPVLTPLRILNRADMFYGVAIIIIIVYLLTKKDHDA